MTNIYLIGMMGAGKTATGQALTKLNGMAFLDLDSEIEIQTHQTINEIFRQKGEPFFRAEERKALDRSLKLTHTVVATGGGIVLDPKNIEKMNQAGRMIYLTASFETLWERVKEKRDRPLLAAADPKAVFYQLFQTRVPLYERAGHWKLSTDGLTPEEAAQKIMTHYLKLESA